MPEVLAVCRVHQIHPDSGAVGVTAIDKRPVEGRVKVRRTGLYADLQADRENHGGIDQAVHVYAQEDADFWSAELGYEVVPGMFGENLRTRGIEVSGAVIGERWAVGSAVFEVTHPRTPCSTFARRLGEKQWVRRFTAANRVGIYLRVVTPGELGAGDDVVVLSRPAHGVTAREWFAARFAVARGHHADDERGDADPRTLEDLSTRLLAAHAAGDLVLSKVVQARAEQAAAPHVLD